MILTHARYESEERLRVGAIDWGVSFSALLQVVWVVFASPNGDGDGSAFPCGQPADGLTTGKPPPPDASAMSC